MMTKIRLEFEPHLRLFWTFHSFYFLGGVKFAKFIMAVNPISRILFGFHIFILFLYFIGNIDLMEIYFSPFLFFSDLDAFRLFMPLYFTQFTQIFNLFLAYVQYKICSEIETEYFYTTPATFFLLTVYAKIGAIISAFIEPEPFLLTRTLTFYLFLSAKLFSNRNLVFNNFLSVGLIPLTYFPIIYIIIIVLRGTDRSVSKLFIFFWSHAYFFFNFCAPDFEVSKFLRAPPYIENFLIRHIWWYMFVQFLC